MKIEGYHQIGKDRGVRDEKICLIKAVEIPGNPVLQGKQTNQNKLQKTGLYQIFAWKRIN